VTTGAGHGVHAAISDAQAVDPRLVQSARARGFQIKGVGRKNFLPRIVQQIGQSQKRLVALKARGRGQCPSGGPCRCGQVAHL
jgi:hypothetical protein